MTGIPPWTFMDLHVKKPGTRRYTMSQMAIDDDHTRLSGGGDGPTLLSNSEQATMLSPLSEAGVAPAASHALVDGQTFGPYQIVRLLGRGGMGEVYEAEHLETGRRVALKLLRGRIDRLEDRERFLREGRLAASLSDPHTVYVFGSEEVDRMPVIAMQLVPGGTLKDRVVTHGPMPVTEAVSAILDVISGLDAAAAAGILHRDIKPSNCFVDADGHVKVGDFGLSIPAEGHGADGSFMGTPQFASPEQLRGEALDVRSDIYAVGATLHYLLTGAAPFESKDFTTLIDRVKHEPPPPTQTLRPGVPKALGVVVAHCLAKAAADRPASYRELAAALKPFAMTGVPARLDVRTLAGAIDFLIVAAVAGVLEAATGPQGVQQGSRSVTFDPWSFGLGLAYFTLCEGRWHASIGKRLLGLRVVSRSGAMTWRQAALRALIYYSPALLMLVPLLIVGAQPLARYFLANLTVYTVVLGAQTALMVLLFSTMRRRNDFAAVQDLLTRTRVVQRATRDLRRRDEVGVESPSGSNLAGVPQRRLGPFVVGQELATVEAGRLMEGVDSVLRRPVWLIECQAETPQTARTRRDVDRVGRLHWLAGRRGPDDNWDAYEAPQGSRFDAAALSVQWPVVYGWLKDLAVELEAAHRDGTTPTLALDRVWIRPDGRAVLLDWPAPGAAPAQTFDTPQQLLAAVGACAINDPASAAMPASAIAMVDRWQRKRAIPLEQLSADLAAVTASSGVVSRSRRMGPLLLAAAPVLFMMLAAAIAMANVDIIPHDRFMTLELLEDLEDEREVTRQQALRTYLAGTYKAEVMAADAPWRVADADDRDAVRMRTMADEVGRLTPTTEEVANAATVLSSRLQRLEQQFLGQDNRTTIFIALLLVGACTSLGAGLVSVIMRPSGLVMSSMGLAVITRRGREVSRVRAIIRLLVAWLPLLVYGALLAWPLTRASVNTIPIAAGAAIPTAVGFLWALLRPTRGPHDWIVGTSIGSR